MELNSYLNLSINHIYGGFMLKLIVTKDVRIRLSLTLASCLSISIKSGTIYDIDNEGYLPLVSCGFEVLVRPITTFPTDSYEIVDTRLLPRGKSHA